MKNKEKKSEKPKVVWICDLEDVFNIILSVCGIVLIVVATALAVVATIARIKEMF